MIDSGTASGVIAAQPTGKSTEPIETPIKLLETKTAAAAGEFVKVKDNALLSNETVANDAVNVLIANNKRAELKEVSKKGNVETVKHLITASAESGFWDVVIHSRLFGVTAARLCAAEMLKKLSNADVDTSVQKGWWDVVRDIGVYISGEVAKYARGKFKEITTADVDAWVQKGWWNVFDYACINCSETMADYLVEVAEKHGKRDILSNTAIIATGRAAALANIKIQDWAEGVKAKIELLCPCEGVVIDSVKAGETRKFLEHTLLGEDEAAKRLAGDALKKVVKRAIGNVLSNSEQHGMGREYFAMAGKAGVDKEKEACYLELAAAINKELDKPPFHSDAAKKMNAEAIARACDALHLIDYGSVAPFLRTVTEKLDRAQASLKAGLTVTGIGGDMAEAANGVIRALSKPTSAEMLPAVLAAQGEKLHKLSEETKALNEEVAAVSENLRKAAEFIEQLTKS